MKWIFKEKIADDRQIEMSQFWEDEFTVFYFLPA